MNVTVNRDCSCAAALRDLRVSEGSVAGLHADAASGLQSGGSDVQFRLIAAEN